MSDFFSTFFFAIGFIGTFWAIGYGIIRAIDHASTEKSQRDERHREISRKLDAIEFQMKLNKERV